MAQQPDRLRPKGGPTEGRYDPRKGAQGYAPIVASFGALAVAAIVVVFTNPPDQSHPENQILATGLLAIAVFASFAGSFALAAIGAEDDPTANIPAALMGIAVPVGLAFIGILGAFQALAATYEPGATTLFALITIAGAAGVVFFTAAIIADSWSMHPTDIEDEEEFNEWRSRQWIQSQAIATRESNVIIIAGMVAVGIALVLRLSTAHITVGITGVSWTVGAGILIALGGTGFSLLRIRHPETGNNQVGLKRWEAWTCTGVIATYSIALVLILPT